MTSVPCICPVIDHQFHHIIVKVAMDSRARVYIEMKNEIRTVIDLLFCVSRFIIHLNWEDPLGHI